MTNHGYVKTETKLRHGEITKVLEDLNATIFKNTLRIEHYDQRGDPLAWGEHVWMIYIKQNPEHFPLVCWLNLDPTSPEFEIRHSGGSNFMEWVDHAIQNEIAVRFDGRILEDATEHQKRGEKGRYDNFHKYLQEISPRHYSDPDFRAFLYECAPEEFSQEESP